MLRLEEFAHRAVPGLRDTIPAYNRLLLEGSPDGWDEAEVEAHLTAGIEACLAEELSPPNADTVMLPVCYDPELGPDLEEVAERAGCTPKDVARVHSDPTYYVLATGFAPGFPYLGDIDESLALPRRPAPRPLVAAGSVAIADRRTGVYPSDSPGGWNLLGRVPSSYFTDVEERIGRFQVGGAVRFVPVSRADYEAECG